METRSRKRAEATSHRPSPATPSRSSKRARVSGAANSNSSSASATAAGAAVSTATFASPRSRPSTRAASSAAPTVPPVHRSHHHHHHHPVPPATATPSAPPMDSSSSGSGSKRSHDKGAKNKESEKEEVTDKEKDQIKEREVDKGKEKESDKEKDHRGRDRDRTALAAAAASGGGGDDDHDGEGGSSLHQNLQSASSALHGLLRKLGAGLDDLLPSSSPSSHQNSRLKRILSGLRAEGEEGRQLDSLSQLCELLSIGTEDSLSSFSVDSFVPVLVGLLNYEYNPDMMLLAARALTHLCDVLPSSCAAVVHYGAVPCFCTRLLTIEYIDLAEQSLQALEKISHEHPTACLRAGALIAVLFHLDFFSTGVQRVAVSTAANICRQLPSDAADFVMEAVPLLTNLLQYQDSKVVEHASVCLTRIAEAFASAPEKLDILCSHGLIPQAARLISVGNSSNNLVPQTSLSTSTYTGLIRLLSTCASGSASAAESLLLLRISSILKDILAGAGLVPSTTVAPSSVNRPPEQLYEIVTLVNELLPPMPESSGTSSASTSNGISVPRISSRKYSAVISPTKPDEAGHGASGETGPREKLLRDQPDLLVQFGVDLFPVLVQVYGSSVNPPVRHKCLAAINKLLHFSTPDMLRSLLKESNISSFLAGVLASKDASILITALQIAEMLMQKVPDVFAKMFVKEGVVHAIDVLIASEIPKQSPPSTAEKSGDASTSGVSGAPPSQRPRRAGSGRRRSTGNNNDTGTVEEPGGSAATHIGSPSNPEPAFRTLRSGLRATAIGAAKHFKETYFSGDSSLADAGATESLRKLKTLCAKLNGEGAVEGKGKGKGKAKITGTTSLSEDELAALMSEILAELGGEEGVSTFEFVGSGIVTSLLNYFAVGSAPRDKLADPNLVNVRQDALKRFKQFVELSLPLSANGKNAALTMLVRKLQNALSSLERFPVVLSHTPRSNSGAPSIAAGLSALTQPFKLRLSRASNEKVLRDYSSKIVLIEPLATLVAVEDFLWARVKRHDSVFPSAASSAADVTLNSVTPAPTPSVSVPVSVERRPSTRSRSAAAGTAAPGNKEPEGMNMTTAKGKGKALSRGTVDGADDHPGPETRNAAARRRAAAVGVAAAKQAIQGAGAQCESEDEELDASPVEIEEAVAMEEDDLSVEEDDEDDDDHEEVFGEEPASGCIGVRVHDVNVGDGGDIGNASTSTPGIELVSQPSGFSSGLAGVSLGGKGSLLAGSDTPTIRTGLSLGTKGSMSFAAAAMAGMASASGNGSRTGLRASSANSPPKLIFSMGGKPLTRSLTIFQAIQRQAVAGDDEEEERYAGPDYPLGGGRRLWDEVYTISYQRADSSGDQVPVGPLSPNTTSASTTSAGQRGATHHSGTESSWQQASLLDGILEGELPCDLEKTNPTYNILLLLRILEGLNHLAPRLRFERTADSFAESGNVDNPDAWQVPGPVVPQEEFLSSKLTPKLARQMQDALALCSGGLPAWCHQLTRACPFLFPFETRRQYFHSTAFGLSRALQRLQQQQSADGPARNHDRELRVGRLQRQKVRVARHKILDSAAKVMELYSSHKAVLEVEYFGEVGTGLGPTLEFYTLLSHELQRSPLELWRTDSTRDDAHGDVEMQDADGGDVDDSYSVPMVNSASMDSARRKGEYVSAPHGLFPRPWPPGVDIVANSKYGKVIEHFRLLGRAMAKALQDARMLDLPLSAAFYKLVLGKELDSYDIRAIDPELGRTLQEMQFLVSRKQFLESSGADKNQEVEALRFGGSKIEDLCLDFTLPGYPDYVLKPGGSEEMVNLDNLHEYVSLVVDATVKTGIAAQLEAFRSGFNQVFQLSTLQIFNEDELDSLLCGRREQWMPETLSDLLKFDHGYTASSPPIRNLLELMGEFTSDEQQAFLRFVTGAPRLPPGGLSTLSPKLTIVRKHPMGITSTGTAVLGSTPPGAASSFGTTLADGDLPSVMTCANYLKLPPYSCKEVMRNRLLYAIWEGQGSFDLS
ncbi:unnamed protein product [Calypogeia fissa]